MDLGRKLKDLRKKNWENNMKIISMDENGIYNRENISKSRI